MLVEFLSCLIEIFLVSMNHIALVTFRACAEREVMSF
jgi:hypothetical protein